MNQYQEQIRNLYLGILNSYPDFAEGEDARLTYDLEAKEWEELRSRYALESVAKTGTAFERAVRLTRYLAPRLTHSSWYDNHVECNALELLAYSFENEKNGGLNHRFRVENIPEEYRHLLDAQEKYVKDTNHEKEPTAYSAQSVYAPPVAR